MNTEKKFLDIDYTSLNSNNFKLKRKDKGVVIYIHRNTYEDYEYLDLKDPLEIVALDSAKESPQIDEPSKEQKGSKWSSKICQPVDLILIEDENDDEVEDGQTANLGGCNNGLMTDDRNSDWNTETKKTSKNNATIHHNPSSERYQIIKPDGVLAAPNRNPILSRKDKRPRICQEKRPILNGAVLQNIGTETTFNEQHSNRVALETCDSSIKNAAISQTCQTIETSNQVGISDEDIEYLTIERLNKALESLGKLKVQDACPVTPETRINESVKKTKLERPIPKVGKRIRNGRRKTVDYSKDLSEDCRKHKIAKARRKSSSDNCEKVANKASKQQKPSGIIDITDDTASDSEETSCLNYTELGTMISASSMDQSDKISSLECASHTRFDNVGEAKQIVKPGSEIDYEIRTQHKFNDFLSGMEIVVGRTNTIHNLFRSERTTVSNRKSDTITKKPDDVTSEATERLESEHVDVNGLSLISSQCKNLLDRKRSSTDTAILVGISDFALEENKHLKNCGKFVIESQKTSSHDAKLEESCQVVVDEVAVNNEINETVTSVQTPNANFKGDVQKNRPNTDHLDSLENGTPEGSSRIVDNPAILPLKFIDISVNNEINETITPVQTPNANIRGAVQSNRLKTDHLNPLENGKPEGSSRIVDNPAMLPLEFIDISVNETVTYLHTSYDNIRGEVQNNRTTDHEDPLEFIDISVNNEIDQTVTPVQTPTAKIRRAVQNNGLKTDHLNPLENGTPKGSCRIVENPAILPLRTIDISANNEIEKTVTPFQTPNAYIKKKLQDNKLKNYLGSLENDKPLEFIDISVINEIIGTGTSVQTPNVNTRRAVQNNRSKTQHLDPLQNGKPKGSRRISENPLETIDISVNNEINETVTSLQKPNANITEAVQNNRPNADHLEPLGNGKPKESRRISENPAIIPSETIDISDNNKINETVTSVQTLKANRRRAMQNNRLRVDHLDPLQKGSRRIVENPAILPLQTIDLTVNNETATSVRSPNANIKKKLQDNKLETDNLDSLENGKPKGSRRISENSLATIDVSVNNEINGTVTFVQTENANFKEEVQKNRPHTDHLDSLENGTPKGSSRIVDNPTILPFKFIDISVDNEIEETVTPFQTANANIKKNLQDNKLKTNYLDSLENDKPLEFIDISVINEIIGIGTSVQTPNVNIRRAVQNNRPNTHHLDPLENGKPKGSSRIVDNSTILPLKFIDISVDNEINETVNSLQTPNANIRGAVQNNRPKTGHLDLLENGKPKGNRRISENPAILSLETIEKSVDNEINETVTLVQTPNSNIRGAVQSNRLKTDYLDPLENGKPEGSSRVVDHPTILPLEFVDLSVKNEINETVAPVQAPNTNIRRTVQNKVLKTDHLISLENVKPKGSRRISDNPLETIATSVNNEISKTVTFPQTPNANIRGAVQNTSPKTDHLDPLHNGKPEGSSRVVDHPTILPLEFIDLSVKNEIDETVTSVQAPNANIKRTVQNKMLKTDHLVPLENVKPKGSRRISENPLETIATSVNNEISKTVTSPQTPNANIRGAVQNTRPKTDHLDPLENGKPKGSRRISENPAILPLETIEISVNNQINEIVSYLQTPNVNIRDHMDPLENGKPKESRRIVENPAKLPLGTIDLTVNNETATSVRTTNANIRRAVQNNSQKTVNLGLLKNGKPEGSRLIVENFTGSPLETIVISVNNEINETVISGQTPNANVTRAVQNNRLKTDNSDLLENVKPKGNGPIVENAILPLETIDLCVNNEINETVTSIQTPKANISRTVQNLDLLENGDPKRSLRIVENRPVLHREIIKLLVLDEINDTDTSVQLPNVKTRISMMNTDDRGLLENGDNNNTVTRFPKSSLDTRREKIFNHRATKSKDRPVINDNDRAVNEIRNSCEASLEKNEIVRRDKHSDVCWSNKRERNIETKLEMRPCYVLISKEEISLANKEILKKCKNVIEQNLHSKYCSILSNNQISNSKISGLNDKIAEINETVDKTQNFVLEEYESVVNMPRTNAGLVNGKIIAIRRSASFNFGNDPLNKNIILTKNTNCSKSIPFVLIENELSIAKNNLENYQISVSGTKRTLCSSKTTETSPKRIKGIVKALLSVDSNDECQKINESVSSGEISKTKCCKNDQIVKVVEAISNLRKTHIATSSPPEQNRMVKTQRISREINEIESQKMEANVVDGIASQEKTGAVNVIERKIQIVTLSPPVNNQINGTVTTLPKQTSDNRKRPLSEEKIVTTKKEVLATSKNRTMKAQVISKEINDIKSQKMKANVVEGVASQKKTGAANVKERKNALNCNDNQDILNDSDNSIFDKFMEELQQMKNTSRIVGSASTSRTTNPKKPIVFIRNVLLSKGNNQINYEIVPPPEGTEEKIPVKNLPSVNSNYEKERRNGTVKTGPKSKTNVSKNTQIAKVVEASQNRGVTSSGTLDLPENGQIKETVTKLPEENVVAKKRNAPETVEQSSNRTEPQYNREEVNETSSQKIEANILEGVASKETTGAENVNQRKSNIVDILLAKLPQVENTSLIGGSSSTHSQKPIVLNENYLLSKGNNPGQIDETKNRKIEVNVVESIASNEETEATNIKKRIWNKRKYTNNLQVDEAVEGNSSTENDSSDMKIRKLDITTDAVTRNNGTVEAKSSSVTDLNRSNDVSICFVSDDEEIDNSQGLSSPFEEDDIDVDNGCQDEDTSAATSSTVAPTKDGLNCSSRMELNMNMLDDSLEKNNVRKEQHDADPSISTKYLYNSRKIVNTNILFNGQPVQKPLIKNPIATRKLSSYDQLTALIILNKKRKQCNNASIETVPEDYFATAKKENHETTNRIHPSVTVSPSRQLRSPNRQNRQSNFFLNHILNRHHPEKLSETHCCLDKTRIARYFTEEQQPKRRQPKLHKCGACSYTTYRQYMLDEHESNEHKDDLGKGKQQELYRKRRGPVESVATFECAHCGHVTRSQRLFDLHCRSSHSKMPLECRNENPRGGSSVVDCHDGSRETNRRWRGVNGKQSLAQGSCGVIAVYQYRHFVLCKTVYKCADCDFQRTILYRVQTHQSKWHPKRMNTTGNIEFDDIGSAPNVNSTRQQNKIITKHACKYCKLISDSAKSLKEHTLNKHILKVYNCVLCGFETSLETSLRQHLLVHENVVKNDRKVKRVKLVHGASVKKDRKVKRVKLVHGAASVKKDRKVKKVKSVYRAWVNVRNVKKVKRRLNCKLCKFSCKHWKQLEHHVNNKHNCGREQARDFKTTCDLCGYEAKELKTLLEHINDAHFF